MNPKRYYHNPIIMPSELNSWEMDATFNGCPIKEKNKIHIFYRAISNLQDINSKKINLSTIGHAISDDGLNYKNRELLIKPEFDWEQYGCEDPRVTKIDDTYYIFYTALSKFPFEPNGIKIGLAKTKDFKKIEKHLVTNFNSKAMALFPEKINGKICAILSSDTDKPPTKIGLAFFEKETDIYSDDYWTKWYKSIDNNKLDLELKKNDHFEVGAPPVKTKEGWLLIYSYIKNYFDPSKKTVFEIRAALLDIKNPFKIIGYSKTPLLIPEKEYEIYGKIPEIVFPSGAYVENDQLHVFYGGADTVCCGVEYSLSEVLSNILEEKISARLLKRHKNNPILKPIENNSWENRSVLNPGAIYENGKVHLLYRAESLNKISVLGYASLLNGLDVDERLNTPVYIPRETFEFNNKGEFYGCEDPRLIRIEDQIYMFYTAFNGIDVPKVAFSWISRNNFIEKKWDWSEPKLLTGNKYSDKDACIFPEKFNDKFLLIHRSNDYGIDIQYIDNLDDSSELICNENNWIIPRKNRWDSVKIGLNGPPIKTKSGWLLFYHGISEDDRSYRLGMILCDLIDPTKILARSDEPIFEPEEAYEKKGNISNVVFSNGHVVIDETVFIYYGGGDKVIGVATAKISDLLNELKKSIPKEN